MMLVKKGPFVKEATGWRRIWNDAGSGKAKDYDIFVPTCGDSDYVALGVACSFQVKHHQEPSARMALVHKSMCVATSVGNQVWSDAGSRARDDVTLNCNHASSRLLPHDRRVQSSCQMSLSISLA